MFFLITIIFSLSLAAIMTFFTLGVLDWIFFDPDPWRRRANYDFIKRVNWIFATVVFVLWMMGFLYSFYRKDIKAWRRRKGF